MFRRTGGGVIEVRAEPRPVTEPYMASEAEGPAAVSGGRESAGDCGRDSGLRGKMSTFISVQRTSVKLKKFTNVANNIVDKDPNKTA